VKKFNKKILFVLLAGLIAAILGYLGYLYFFKSQTTADITHSECKIKNPDTDGYLIKICNYLKEHPNVQTAAEPTKYKIQKIEENDYLRPTDDKRAPGTKTIIVSLDCCGTGDLAYIDKETKEVIGFSVGDR